MRKRILAITLSLLALGSLGMTSCSNKARDRKVDSVAVKLDGRQTEISQEEYSAALDYLEEAYKDMDALRNDPNHEIEYKARKSKEWDEKYPRFQEMLDLVNMDPEKLDSTNRARLQKVQTQHEAQQIYVPLGQDEVKTRPRED